MLNSSLPLVIFFEIRVKKFLDQFLELKLMTDQKT